MDNSDEHYQQDQINELRTTITQLEITARSALEKAADNETHLAKLSDQVSRVDGTVLRMRADLPTKDDLQEALTTTLNAHLAKGVWVVVLSAIGALTTWLVSHINFKQ